MYSITWCSSLPLRHRCFSLQRGRELLLWAVASRDRKMIKFRSVAYPEIIVLEVPVEWLFDSQSRMPAANVQLDLSRQELLILKLCSCRFGSIASMSMSLDEFSQCHPPMCRLFFPWILRVLWQSLTLLSLCKLSFHHFLPFARVAPVPPARSSRELGKHARESRQLLTLRETIVDA